jgi:hypothetical protein
MRIRVARFSLALVLAAAMATVGITGTAVGPHVVLPDLSRTAAAQAHAAAAAGLPGLHGVVSAHTRAPAVDAVLVPAALLTTLVLAWVFSGRRRATTARVVAPADARAPPA